uniref:HMG box domain-containing protein n=1 Tax=Anopheles atroparvus TaxID=41427 RepID=A0AAG5CXF5_ANOAO
MSCFSQCCIQLLLTFTRFLTERKVKIRQESETSNNTHEIMSASESKPTAKQTTETRGEPSTSRNAMSCNPGKRSRNPYLNYLREFRRKNCHLSAVEVVRQGAEQWRKMTDEQKLPFIRTAFYTAMRPRRCPACRMVMGRSRRYANVQPKKREAARMKQSQRNNR